jgi:hypothetical protein
MPLGALTPIPLLVRLQLLGAELMCRGDQKTLQRREVAREFERFAGDTGSTEVQGGWVCAAEFGGGWVRLVDWQAWLGRQMKHTGM